MIQGIYLAAQGMTPIMDKQDQIANNLANVNTTGFKQSNLFVKAYQKYLENDQRQPFVNRDVKPDEVYTDYREGPMQQTGNNLDLMIKGSGFFTVMTPDGIRYTRNGGFSLDRDGYLVTQEGSRVMGNEGFIRVTDTTKGPLRIETDGRIYQGDQEKGCLHIADFNKPYKMIREGNGNFRPELPNNPEMQSKGFAVEQGYLEGSNVDMMRNMVDMISAYRTFEADQKALQAQDHTLDKAVNEVGKVG